MQSGTVLALRLPGLAERRAALDPEEMREFTHRLQTVFEETVVQHGGVADRLSGDRMHAVFGLENVSGNEPQKALRAAHALQQVFAASDLHVGAPAMGVAQGSLLPTRINGPFPLAGNPVGSADDLSGRAQPGEIALADDLRRALGGRYVPFAGRHAELTLMTALLERSIAARRGRTVVVRGEAGIGKSRLLEAFRESASAQGASCHRVQVLDFGQVKARRPLAALFASLLGVAVDANATERGAAIAQAILSGRLAEDSVLHASGLIGAPLSPDHASIERNLDPQALEHGRMEVVRRLIESACTQAPLLLIIEDLHYAGGEEAARLGELAAAVAGQPALLLLSTRPDEDPIDAAWRARARGCPADDARPRAAHGGRVARARRELQRPAGGDGRGVHPPCAGPSAVPGPAPAGGRRRRHGDAGLGAGARAFLRREARARRPSGVARSVGARASFSGRRAGVDAGWGCGRAGPAGGPRAAHY
jgi:class 3 adenylate cyclase